MIIAKNKMVSLTFDLHVDNADGELLEQVTAENPLSFIYGYEMMPPDLESKLEGLKQGEPFKVNCKDAYGEFHEEDIIELPRDIFVVNGTFDSKLVKVGNMVPMMSTSGQRMNGIVLEITDNSVTMNFNHPYAGKNLFFKGQVLEVRDATDEEIAAVASGCGCGCHGHSHDCDGDCNCDDCDGEHDEEHDGCGCGCNH
jgi:FKBP-type peptidyl-prolyl cis-trans isomerases 2